jgi:hypothetical protein
MKLLAQKSLKTELWLKSIWSFEVLKARLQISRCWILNKLRNQGLDLNL